MDARPRTLFRLGCRLRAVAIALPLCADRSDTARGRLYGLAAGCLLASLLRRWLPEPCDTAPPALRTRYLREFLPPLAGYVVALWISLTLLPEVEAANSEARRIGKECDSTCRSRWSPYH